MKSLIELKKQGYSFSTDGKKLEYKATNPVDPSIVKPLFEELKKHKTEAIEFLQSQQSDLDPRLQYNTLLAKEQKIEKYLDDPIRTPEELEKCIPKFHEIVNELNQILEKIGISNCSVNERINGFDIASYSEVVGME